MSLAIASVDSSPCLVCDRGSRLSLRVECSLVPKRKHCAAAPLFPAAPRRKEERLLAWPPELVVHARAVKFASRHEGNGRTRDRQLG